MIYGLIINKEGLFDEEKWGMFSLIVLENN